MTRHKIAIVWRGDAASRAVATPQNNRYRQIFSELLALGIEAEPAVYCEEMQDEVRAQLVRAEGALVWVNPLEGGRTRRSWTPCCATSPRQVASSARILT